MKSGDAVRGLRGLVVARNGRPIAERHYRGATPSDLWAIQSITKSVTSMLLGLALQQGKIKSLTETVGSLLPEAAARVQSSPANAVTLAQILTGTSGLIFDNALQGNELLTAPDPVHFVQSLTAAERTPSAWAYNNAAVSLLSPILRRALGMPLEEFAKRELFSRLGIEHFEWERDNTGNAMSWKGLSLRPHDLAKIGWTMADGGRWLGSQVVPAEWAADSTRAHVAVSWQFPPISNIGYGYLWFTGILRERPIVWGLGYGAQFTMFVPSLRLVITAAARTPGVLDVIRQNIEIRDLITKVVGLAS